MSLSAASLSKHPMQQFDIWYKKAKEEVTQADAMCISTVNDKGFPDSRYVLLKDYDDTGMVFYTNLRSTKSQHIKLSCKVAVNFYWQSLGRQIRIQGYSHQIEDEIADQYFATRSRGAQIGAWASKQSQTLESRHELERRVEKYQEQFDGKEVPRPPFWSGFKISPVQVEFWQSRENRLHDRFVYTKIEDDETWKLQRLFP